jgi:hypothetical protein
MLKMLRSNWCSTGVLAVLLAGSGFALQAQTAPAPRTAQSPAGGHVKTSKAKATAKKQKAKKQATVAPPAPPPPPPSPEQMPAQPPQVSYSGGQLTINTDNSTMNDVLAAVRRVTGASIEKPPMGGNERVVAHLGPGDAKDVLTALFNGSRYDYIILGPMGQPGGVQRIILTTKSSAPSQPAVAANGTTQPRPNVAPPPGADQEQPDTSETEDMTVPEQNAPEQEPPPSEEQQPAQEQQQPPQSSPQAGTPEPPQAQNPQAQDQGQEPQQPHVKTPEELLRELQQMQKQQQNQQQPPQ